MKVSEIVAAVRSGAENDMSIPEADIIQWIDFGINRINTALECNIPKVTGQATTIEPSFDSRYHEALVIYGVNKYREADGDYNAAQYLLGQFDSMVNDMQRDMVIQPSIKADYNYQQIVVTNASTLTYNLTMPSGSYFDQVVVYKNDVELDPSTYTISFQYKTIKLTGTLAVNDKITIKFENNSDLNSPPYQWWGQSGW